MLLDHLFGRPLPKVLKIVRKDGKMKTAWEIVPVDKNEFDVQAPIKPLFPINKERK